MPTSFMHKVGDCLIVAVLAAFSLFTIIPFIYVLVGSITSPEEMLSKGFVLIPKEVSFESYRYIFSTDTLLSSLSVTFYITIVGTFLNLVFTSLMAYPLAKQEFKGRRTVMALVLFTMLFSGGMIPLFLVVKSLGLIDSLWSLMLPIAINPFYLIVMVSFFENIPEELEESAKMDGANDLLVFFRIILPLSKPALATFALFYAVNHWNTFFNAIIFINDSTKWPIQVLLRQIVILSSEGLAESGNFEIVPPEETVKLAVIVVSTLPIMVFYPFLQKHFTKGMMLGAVKG